MVIANNVAIPNTAGWQTWQDVTVTGLQLDAGVQIIRVLVGAPDYLNLNYMTFVAQTQPKPTIPLIEGWNLIGCPLQGSTDIATALSSIWANVLTVKDMTSFYDKSQTAMFNLLPKLVWGCGYLVKVDKACVLTW